MAQMQFFNQTELATMRDPTKARITPLRAHISAASTSATAIGAYNNATLENCGT
ncbi:hypothetical protein SAMN05421748_10594 [Paractinoplanes atraurantiacus]|uniref:Uncharacterized protein n=1 Tax=Paractinoplanes atraurantiacus TaxID=1036182 RepID=A0A285HNV9_9ACTN|nr:hypothetical protein SAMN05421748_10594 [Actinoplanes atraurantiacus]